MKISLWDEVNNLADDCDGVATSGQGDFSACAKEITKRLRKILKKHAPKEDPTP